MNDFDFLETNDRIRRLRNPPRQQTAGLIALITAGVASVLLLGAWSAYQFHFQPLRPAAEWAGGPKTYAEAVRIWRDESEMLGRLRISRLAAKEKSDKADDTSEFETVRARDERMAAVRKLDVEVADWDRAIGEQERKVEQARIRKKQLDR